MSMLAFCLIFFPFKDLLIVLPSIIIKLVIALINVSIVLNVKASAKTNMEIITKKLSLDSIRWKKAKSGFISEFREKDIKPEYPIHITIKKVIIAE